MFLLIFFIVASVSSLPNSITPVANITSDEDRVAAVEENAHRINKRQAVKDRAYTWPNGVVPYEISNYYSWTDKQIIMSGIAEYHRYTCIRLVPRTTQTDYVVFEEHYSGTCWAGKWGDQRVGRLGGRMVISLIRSQSCLRKFNVIHELMHILGFWHEQQREDRDQYVSINFQNVKQEFQGVAFAKHSQNHGSHQITHLDTPYDTSSIMNYHPYSFAINPNIPTIVPRDGCSFIGNEDNFSKIDVWRINKLYRCPAHQRPTPPKVQTCVDKSSNCASWASGGYCHSNPGFMKQSCRRSCGLCCPASSCRDSHTRCREWTGKGECEKNPEYMYVNCRKSCEIC